MDKDSRIYVSGDSGLVGSALVKRLKNEGYKNIITKTHNELDLRDQSKVNELFSKEKPEYVFAVAGKVGGIVANATYPAEFMYDNIMMEFNIIRSCYENNVKKLLFIGSSCVYPRDCKQPIKEEYLLKGNFEKTNEGFAIAKIAGLKYIEYLNKEYGTKYISIMPTNLYGVNDKYDETTSHVIPGIIDKMHKAKINNLAKVTLWGTGKPLREFLYADDLADACVYLMQNYNENEIINVGSGEEKTIEQIANMIKEVVGYKGKIVFDSSYPDGTYRKKLDLTKLEKIGWKSKTTLKQGLPIAYKDYLKRMEK